MLRFERSFCPRCSEPACKMSELVSVEAYISLVAGSGTINPDFEYDGESDVDWSSQSPAYDKQRQVRLSCPNAHSWSTVLEYKY